MGAMAQAVWIKGIIKQWRMSDACVVICLFAFGMCETMLVEVVLPIIIKGHMYGSRRQQCQATPCKRHSLQRFHGKDVITRRCLISTGCSKLG